MHSLRIDSNSKTHPHAWQSSKGRPTGHHRTKLDLMLDSTWHQLASAACTDAQMHTSSQYALTTIPQQQKNPQLLLTFHHLQVDVVLQVGGDVCHLCMQAQADAQQVVQLPRTLITPELWQSALNLNLQGGAAPGRQWQHGL
jgi:hypothetical protein